MWWSWFPHLTQQLMHVNIWPLLMFLEEFDSINSGMFGLHHFSLSPYYKVVTFVFNIFLIFIDCILISEIISIIALILWQIFENTNRNQTIQMWYIIL